MNTEPQQTVELTDVTVSQIYDKITLGDLSIFAGVFAVGVVLTLYVMKKYK